MRNALLIVLLTLVVAGGIRFFGPTGYSPEPAPSSQGRSFISFNEADLSESLKAGIAALLDEIWKETQAHHFEKALALCAQGKDKFGSVALTDDESFSSFKDVFESAEMRVRCIQRNPAGPRGFSSEAQLQQALLEALRQSDSRKLSALLPCGIDRGVPFSEYDPVYQPEKLADGLVELRRDTKTEKPLKFTSSVTGHKIITEGYSDQLMRRFETGPAEDSPAPRITTLLEGTSKDVLESP